MAQIAPSLSSAATAGLRTDNTYRYGDVIIGKKPTPSWVWLSLGGMALLGLIVWVIVKRK